LPFVSKINSSIFIQTMIISKNKVVTVTYQLHEGSANGHVVEETSADEPFVFLFGGGNLLPDFEANLNGLKEGDSFQFNIDSNNAYGEADPSAVVELPLSIFVIDGQIAGDLLQIGNVVPMRNDQGHLLHGKVVSIGANEVMMDFNHPMAGKDLFFSGTVLSVREASPTEIEHGHVHGADGHHHSH
jgi:FKBP-type peptidyl-prolyl cis-trans isomerase SlyD